MFASGAITTPPRKEASISNVPAAVPTNSTFARFASLLAIVPFHRKLP
jgi:hypothetical protein